MDYSIMVTLICVAHLYACIHLIKFIAQNESEGTRFSLVTISYLTSWDIFMCLFHLYNALTINVRITNLLLNVIGLLPLFHHTSLLVFHSGVNLRNKIDDSRLENSIL